MSRVARGFILFISQGAYAGRFPVAPGTAGTVVGVLLYLGIKDLAPLWYLSLCVLLFLAGTWAAGRAEKILGCTDCPSIVIDEIAGYIVAMFMAPTSWGFIVAGFILFRAFDIAKPWPLRRLEELHGGLGVMLDDIGAGMYANLVLQAAGFFLS
jgi:phosphatidylglycerophosphatase A